MAVLGRILGVVHILLVVEAVRIPHVVEAGHIPLVEVGHVPLVVVAEHIHPVVEAGRIPLAVEEEHILPVVEAGRILGDYKGEEGLLFHSLFIRWYQNKTKQTMNTILSRLARTIFSSFIDINE
ncbi:unnamed protein product [Owenia fusiformis]|uniref:Secreted protein n=1 Tax=Owenia fusiformis TaxID=6347 RepID=A0A8S4P1H3_OWEFU|nr:unnamed protein product [Owenia fusiformis]